MVLSLTLGFAVAPLLNGNALAHKEAYSQLGAVYPQRIKVAPEFSLKDLTGKTVDLKDLRGKPVLLNFWATWCQACKEELPSMQRLHETMKNEGVQVIAISIDRADPEEVQKYVDQYKLTFPVLLDPNQETRRRYFIMGLPTSYLIDANGKLRGFISGSREWDSETSKRVMRILLNKEFNAGL
ncbi:MAG: TlpA family protein disulfide reductase [Candidatus Nitronauta litoralis]|uniref:TlpA family protein disulfide reductase n=1 Tax=Candidatus Nitronauta litoralis TaxID=2705533 RepID=A0A7T0BZN5_9BACT|nr:MAG: TlpA family protein disulfide reductase [Candidatus Nitronauta litoralis]